MLDRRNEFKVSVYGPAKEKQGIADIASELQGFIEKELEEVKVQSETVQHKCKN